MLFRALFLPDRFSNYWVVLIGYIKTIHEIYVVQSLANIDGVAKQQAFFGVTNGLL